MDKARSPRIFGLDALRAAAILSVLALHSLALGANPPAWLAAVFSRGWAGVDLFFVLSGFLIAEQLFDRERLDVREFWMRRWTRTLPLYYAVLIAYLVIKPLLFHFPARGFDWRFTFFLQNTSYIQDFVQSWSLCIEEQFYLIFPLLLLIFKPKRPIAWLTPLALSLVWRLVVWHQMGLPSAHGAALEPTVFDPKIRFNTLAHLDAIGAGIFLAATRVRWMAFNKNTKTLLGVTGVAVLAATLAGIDYTPGDLGLVFQFTLLAAAFGAILIGAHDLPRPPPAISKVVERIALCSYSAYLWNELFMRLFAHFSFAMPWAVRAAGFLVVVLVFSWFSYQLIEKPGLRLRSRFFRREGSDPSKRSHPARNAQPTTEGR